MNLMDIVSRTVPPVPWEEGEKIPWHDPGFSERMLREHLSQEHDAASRRAVIIEGHVAWLHTQVMGGKSSRVLDLGCGPGLYTSRLAQLGHSAVGIDYSPASIRYARAQAEAQDIDCIYIQADVRQADFGTGFGLVMMIHGELNVFRPEETVAILGKARRALLEGGKLVLEVHKLSAVRALGEAGSSWRAVEKGLFSERPYLLLEEAFWDTELQVATERYYIVDAQTGRVTRHAASNQGYEHQEYVRLLESCRFGRVHESPSLGGEEGVIDKHYVVYIAEAMG